MNSCISCGSETTNPKFCNRSCAAKVNNRLTPKRQPQHECLNCDNPVNSRRRYCNPQCRNEAFAKRKVGKPNKVHVANNRRKNKAILIEEHGGECVDCGFVGAPFMFDFDHRNPEEKNHGISFGNSISLDKLRKEAEKCDLVCAICHRMRTHKQRCSGCEYCI